MAVPLKTNRSHTRDRNVVSCGGGKVNGYEYNLLQYKVVNTIQYPQKIFCCE